MIVALAVLLLVNAVFNIVVWPRFWKRVSTDPRARNADGSKTAFYTVHAVLISTALVLALASLVAAIWALVAGA